MHCAQDPPRRHRYPVQVSPTERVGHGRIGGVVGRARRIDDDEVEGDLCDQAGCGEGHGGATERPDPRGDVGPAGIVVRPTPELLTLQRDLHDAVEPFTVDTGGSGAFVTDPDDLVIDPQLISYVETFEAQAAGENFNPHVTTGVGPRAYLDQMLAQPFDTFTSGVAGAAVYQLGQWGTASKRLETLT